MAKTVLAIDIGSSTITAAVASGASEDPLALTAGESDGWPAVVYAAANGALVTDPTRAATKITRFTRLLGREAQVIAGSPRHADSLVTSALSPVLAAAANTFGGDPEVVVATFPSTWPQRVVDAFRHAVSAAAQASEVVMVPWSEAIAAQTYPPDPYVACPVTALDFGARSASVTMVDVDERGNSKVLYSITNPTGGFVGAARAVITVVAERMGIDVGSCEEHWWETAASALASSRLKAAEESVVVDFPDPIGPVSLAYADVTELFVEHLGGFDDAVGVLHGLLNRAPVTRRWTLENNPLAARPIVELTGGFAQDVAVQIAVRNFTTVTPTVVQLPAHAAAWGAARLVYERSRRRLPAAAV